MKHAKPSTEPSDSCATCPRLCAFRKENCAAQSAWYNAPVPSFGGQRARLLVVGLAPGLKGANRTGRPFTGDYAGDLLYATLLETGFAAGTYGAQSDDGLQLIDCRITNAVRCVPPQNKPTTAEIAACRPYLAATIEAMPLLAAILCLGRIAHDSVITAIGQRKSALPFAHGSHHGFAGRFAIFDSYHCSRYNTNTGVLTREMFRSVLRNIRAHLDNR